MSDVAHPAPTAPQDGVAWDQLRVVLTPRGARNAPIAPDRDDPPAARRYLPALQFAVFNLAAFALFGAAAVQGWIRAVVEADTTGLSIAIFAVFLAGLAISGRRIWELSRELDSVEATDPGPRSRAVEYLSEIEGRDAGSRALSASALRLKVFDGIAGVRHIANSLVLLGLIGTVLGFIIALSGVDPGVAGDVRAIGPMVAELIRGMSVALYTTLVGAVLNLWLTVNYRILATTAVALTTRLVALGEANARSRPA